MKKDKYWKKLFFIMLCLLFLSLVFMGNLDFFMQYTLMVLCMVGIIVLIVLITIKYYKGEYTTKQYTGRVVSIALPYLPLPVYTFFRVLLYYKISHDSDPLGFLWVLEVIPITVFFIIAIFNIMLILFIMRNKRKKGQIYGEQY